MTINLGELLKSQPLLVGMTINLGELLNSQPLLVFFLTLGFGYLVGNIEFRKFKLGATAGVLLVGMFFGHFGFMPHPESQQIGFILFIYCVGFQAGPRFFAVFAKDGKRYFILAAFIAALAVIMAQTFHALFKLPPGSAAGMLAGSLTSTPTLAAAQGSLAQGAVEVPPGETIASLENNLTVSYAMTYIYGLVGLMMMVRLLPAFMKIDLVSEARKLEQEAPQPGGDQDEDLQIVTRAYEVTSKELIGQSLKALDFRKRTGCLVECIKRDGAPIDPAPDTVLKAGDRIAVVGDAAMAANLSDVVGPEVRDRDLLAFQVTSCQVVVTKPEVIGRPISELGLAQRGGCFLTRIVRAHVPLPVNAGVVLERGDTVQFSGVRTRLKMLAPKFGHIEREVHETDLLTMAFGIAIGLVLGQFAIQAGSWSLTLGAAGGLLLTGLTIGFLRSYQPTFGSMPEGARYIFTEMGMMFFMANVGLSAGKGIVDAFMAVGPTLILCGVAMTTVPVVIGFFFGRYVLKLNPAVLLGALTGSMTSTPALGVISKATQSTIPSLGYAGTYTFANVFLTMAGTIIIRLS